MDLYTTISSWIGWPVIVALLLVSGTFGYFVLDNRIQTLKETNEHLKTKNDELKEYRPDVLAQRLAERLKTATEELERLNSDQMTSKETIHNKEIELNNVKKQIKTLQDQMIKADDLLRLMKSRGLVCPKCGAALSTREFRWESIEFDGRDIDVDHEIITYECGLEMLDGQVQRPCSNKSVPVDKDGW